MLYSPVRMAPQGSQIPSLHPLHLDLWAGMIQIGGSLIIIVYACAALLILLRRRASGIVAARLLIAHGVLTGLGFTLAGTLLKMILLVMWHGILIFAVIFDFRTLLKRLFVWEQTHFQQRDLMP
jgi:hypothetical protein